MIQALHGLKLYGKKLDVQREYLAGQELDNFLIAEKMLHKVTSCTPTLCTPPLAPLSLAPLPLPLPRRVS